MHLELGTIKGVCQFWLLVYTGTVCIGKALRVPATGPPFERPSAKSNSELSSTFNQRVNEAGERPTTQEPAQDRTMPDQAYSMINQMIRPSWRFLDSFKHVRVWKHSSVY